MRSQFMSTAQGKNLALTHTWQEKHQKGPIRRALRVTSTTFSVGVKVDVFCGTHGHVGRGAPICLQLPSNKYYIREY